MSEMILPDDKRCSDCRHVRKCTCIFGVKPENTECDFYPIRFVESKEPPKE